jgi:hypothetical protein
MDLNGLGEGVGRVGSYGHLAAAVDGGQLRLGEEQRRRLFRGSRLAFCCLHGCLPFLLCLTRGGAAWPAAGTGIACKPGLPAPGNLRVSTTPVHERIIRPSSNNYIITIDTQSERIYIENEISGLFFDGSFAASPGRVAWS